MSKQSAAIFDVATDRVAAVLVEPVTTGNQCLALAAGESVELPYQTELNPERLLATSLKALTEAAQNLVKQKIPPPKHFFCFLASPFYAPQTRISRLAGDTSRVVNHKLIKDLVAQERGRFLESLNDSGEKLGQIVDQEILQVKLNRYATENPEHQTAKEIEVASFFSWSERVTLNKLADALRPVFHQAHTVFHSSNLAIFRAFRQVVPEEGEALLLQIGGEVTELSLVHAGVLLETVSYPLGFNFLRREIGGRLNLSGDAALSLLRLGQKEGMSDKEQEKFQEILEEMRFKWLAVFTELLRALAEHHFLAGKIFLLGDIRFNKLFSTWLQSKNFTESGILKKNLMVELLGEKLQGKFCPPEEQKLFPDDLLLADALLCAKILTS